MAGHRRAALVWGAAAMLIGCGVPATSPSPTTSEAPATIAAAPNTHVFVIVMENEAPQTVLAQPFLSALAAHNGLATNYHAVGHPSAPNYLALESGSTWGQIDDSFRTLPPHDLAHQLTATGISWRGYMDGMSGDCLRNHYPYAVKHDPFPYFGGSCPPAVVPLTALAGDLGRPADTPRFVWITPDLCHDDHDCPPSAGDAFLATTVPQIMASAAWRDGGVLFITWDEGYSVDNAVATLVMRPGGGAQRSAIRYDHYSLLATIEDLLGVPRLGGSRSAPAMADLAGPVS